MSEQRVWRITKTQIDNVKCYGSTLTWDVGTVTMHPLTSDGMTFTDDEPQGFASQPEQSTRLIELFSQGHQFVRRGAANWEPAPTP